LLADELDRMCSLFLGPNLVYSMGAKLHVRSLLEANGRVARLSEGWDVKQVRRHTLSYAS
jgi:hypothetical protein